MREPLTHPQQLRRHAIALGGDDDPGPRRRRCRPGMEVRRGDVSHGNPTAVTLLRRREYRTDMAARGGPLSSVRVLELVGLGPGPYCGMLLADLGADVLRIDRVTTGETAWTGVLERSKRSAGVDLRNPDGLALLLDLVA